MKKKLHSNKRRPDRLSSGSLGNSRTESQSKSGTLQGEIPAIKSLEPTEIASLLRQKIILAALLLVVFVWSYWQTLGGLVNQWERIPDYSHGYLVLPLAIFFLWARRDRFPGANPRVAWPGLILIFMAGALRVFAATFYLEPVDGWSIPIWFAGMVWLFGGWQVFCWAFPPIFFLFFMVPLPYIVETMLSQPLQAISTKVSTFMLQCGLYPAIAEGNTIVLGEERMEVARACSGLRIFLGIAALAYALMILFPRAIWCKILIALSVLPIAIFANSLRIVATGMLFQMGFQEAAKRLSHDVAGWIMIPLAAAMFWLVLLFLDRLFVPINRIDVAAMLRQQSSES